MNDTARVSPNPVSSVIWFVLRWSLLTGVVLFLDLMTSCTMIGSGLENWPYGTYVESEPAGAEIRLGGELMEDPTPSYAQLGRRGGTSAGDVEVRWNGKVARARNRRTPSLTLGTHRWTNRMRQELDPVLSGALWVGRRDDAMRVWFPRSGRVLCGIGLFDYGSRTFYLDGEKIRLSCTFSGSLAARKRPA